MPYRLAMSPCLALSQVPRLFGVWYPPKRNKKKGGSTGPEARGHASFRLSQSVSGVLAALSWWAVRRHSPSCRSFFRSVFRPASTDGSYPAILSAAPGILRLVVFSAQGDYDLTMPAQELILRRYKNSMTMSPEAPR